MHFIMGFIFHFKLLKIKKNSWSTFFLNGQILVRGQHGPKENTELPWSSYSFILFCFNKKIPITIHWGSQKCSHYRPAVFLVHNSPTLCTFSSFRWIKCVKAGLLSVMIRVCIQEPIQTLLKWTEELLSKSKFLIVPHLLLSRAKAYIYRSMGPKHFLYISDFELS